MSNIRFVRQADRASDEWEFDCIMSPTDRTDGELIHYHPNRAKDFRNVTESGLYAALDNLLDRVAPGQNMPKENVRLAIERLKDGKRTYYWLSASDGYSLRSPEAEIWKLVNTLYEKRLKEVGQSK